MRGILSAAPGPLATRLMIGTQMLLLIQTALVLWSAPHLDIALRVLVALLFTLAVGAFGAAIHGLSGDNSQTYGRRRHGR